MSKSLSLSIEKTANQCNLTVAEALRILEIPNCTFWVWKNGKNKARPKYKARVRLMMDGLKYRHPPKPSVFRRIFSL